LFVCQFVRLLARSLVGALGGSDDARAPQDPAPQRLRGA